MPCPPPLLLALALLAQCSLCAVQTGADVLLASPQILPSDSGRMGILAAPTSILANLTHVVDALAAINGTRNINLAAIFGPEHGFRGDEQAGSGGENYTIDPRTQLPVYSLYALNTSQLARVLTLSTVNTILVDLQDVGTRFYTYLWTMYDLLHTLALHPDLPVKYFIVLDRPNPLGGLAMAGPVLEPAFASFIGRIPLPQQYGMTMGELAKYFFSSIFEHQPPPRFQLQVVAMVGWRRSDTFGATQLPWVLPSPNMPTPDTAAVYPGLGILEGTNLSEGRGTTRPFEMFGAAFLNWTFTQQLLRLARSERVLLGGSVRETYFIPTFSKFVGNVTCGAQLYITDPEAFNAVAWGLAVVMVARQLAPDHFEFLDGGADFDLHMGTNKTRLAILAGENLTDIVDGWAAELQRFDAYRHANAIYPWE